MKVTIIHVRPRTAPVPGFGGTADARAAKDGVTETSDQAP